MRLDPAYYGTIRASRIPREPRKIIGFDTEDDGRGHPKLFAFHDGEKAHVFTKPEEAVRFILTYPQDVPVLFFAHNLEYDMGNLFKGGDFGFVKGMVKSEMLLSVSLYDCKHELRNSQAYFSGSVADMGETIGLQKLAFNPDSPEYASRDAQIVQVYMSSKQERLQAEFGVPLGVSLGHTAALILASLAPKKGWRSYNHPEVLNAFYGGRTEIFRLGTHEEPITVADVNSAFSYAMAANPYPDCRFLRKSTLQSARLGVGRFTIRVPAMPFPPLPWRSERGGIYFPTGDISGWWCYAEVRRALELGCKVIREEPGIGTDYAVHPFGGFVGRLFNGKSSREAQKDRFLREHYKSLLVSGYGKLIQSNAERRYTTEKPEGDCLRVGPFWEQRQELVKAPPMSNYMWGVHVTAYARLHLLDQLLKAHNAGAKVLYCDTDAVMYTGKAPLNFGPGLGQLSAKHYDAGFFRLSKGYVLCSKTAKGYKVESVHAKGVPREHGLEFLRRGVASAFKPVRLRRGLVTAQGGGSMLEQAEGLNVWREVTKTIRHEYLKRPREKGDYTRAPEVREIADIERRSGGAAPAFTLRDVYEE